MQHHYLLTHAGQQFVTTHYTEWGAADNPNVICCVHGLTRNCRDFDEVAQALCGDFRVVCVDVAGRGESGWLDNAQQYNYGTYVNQLAAVLAHINAPRLQWVGTSMGGILGMLLAALPYNPIRQMVISDVGPVIPKEALQGIAQYLGKAPAFRSINEVEQYLRQVHSGFGKLSDEQWRHLARHSSAEHQGTWSLRYDPAIAKAFGDVSADVDLTPVWQQMKAPVLVLRGAQSQLLTKNVAQQMAQREHVSVQEFDSVGHAPMMMSEDQIAVVREFLLRDAGARNAAG